MSSSRSVLTAAYAVSGSKRPGSMMKTFMNAVSCGGVTFDQCSPPSAVVCDHAIVGSDPDAVDVAIRRADRVDHLRAESRRAPRLHARRVGADALRHVPFLARQVRADLLPVDPAVDRLPQHVVAVEQRVLVDGREDDRLRAHRAVDGVPRGRRAAAAAARLDRADVRRPVPSAGRSASPCRRRRCRGRADRARRSRIPRRRPDAIRGT